MHRCLPHQRTSWSTHNFLFGTVSQRQLHFRIHKATHSTRNGTDESTLTNSARVSSLFKAQSSSIIARGWTVQRRNLRFLSKFNHNTVRWFQASFRRVLGVFVTWWCFMIFVVIFGFFSDFSKFTKHHQVTSTPKTLQNPAWNHLTVLWLNFERNRRFFFSTVQALLITEGRNWRLVFRVIDDDLEEPDAEIAVVVLKDGERVSLGKTVFLKVYLMSNFSSFSNQWLNLPVRSGLDWAPSQADCPTTSAC